MCGKHQAETSLLRHRGAHSEQTDGNRAGPGLRGRKPKTPVWFGTKEALNVARRPLPSFPNLCWNQIFAGPFPSRGIIANNTNRSAAITDGPPAILCCINNKTRRQSELPLIKWWTNDIRVIGGSDVEFQTSVSTDKIDSDRECCQATGCINHTGSRQQRNN